jgi:hypothetical protein
MNTCVKILAVFGLLFLHTICFAMKYTGRLLCKETGLPVEYANIGIVGKNVGTTSNLKGEFTINLEDIYDHEQLRISSIGFEPLEMKVSKFISAYQDEHTIYLSAQISELKEVVIRPVKNRHKQIGNTANSKFMVAGFDTCLPGYETGVLMKIRQTPTYIDSVTVNVCSCELDSVFFRLNIYEHIDSDFVNILKEPIYINMAATEIAKHHILVNLSQKNISVTHDFLVSVELVKDMGRHKMYFCASLNKNGYVRKTSQGNWHRIPLGATSVSAFVTY